jgi:hypothetical protein
MRRRTVSERAQAWVVDYSAARKQAIRWLGDRYLLAKPINARETAWHKAAAAAALRHESPALIGSAPA